MTFPVSSPTAVYRAFPLGSFSRCKKQKSSWLLKNPLFNKESLSRDLIDWLIGRLLLCASPRNICLRVCIGNLDLPVRRGRSPFRAGQGVDGGGWGHHGESGALLGRRWHGLENEARGQHDHGHHDEQLGEWGNGRQQARHGFAHTSAKYVFSPKDVNVQHNHGIAQT